MTLREWMIDAIKFDEPTLAYSIYWAAQNGLSLDGNFESLKQAQLDHAAIAQLIESDPLGIRYIKLYSWKDGAGFHLVLATNEQQARECIYSVTGKRADTLHDVTERGMDVSLWDVQRNRTELIRDIKADCVQFPHYIGMVVK